MGDMTFTNPPDERAYPGKGREDHVYKKTNHKDLKRAVFGPEKLKEDPEQAISEAENHPGNQTGRQQISRRAKETDHGEDGEEAEKRGAGEIALESKTFKKREAIGNKGPGGQNKGEANADVNTHADCHVLENVEPTVTRQMCSNGHGLVGSQDSLVVTASAPVSTITT
jgi:hypothetical protein